MHTFSTLSLIWLASGAAACYFYDFCRCYDTRVNLNNEEITRKACDAMGGVMAWGDPEFGQRVSVNVVVLRGRADGVLVQCRKPNLSGHTDEPGTIGFYNWVKRKALTIPASHFLFDCNSDFPIGQWRRQCKYHAGTNGTDVGGVESHVYVDHCVETYFEGENGKSYP
ncbi:hypothetical protein Tdes44962_MAKER01436 [Teratosphaeria destructans]|uniref:Uncharacterized protein n=1 Tax=Teratosphaeria destructans TaxID=418781 RepID=A0A9W7SZP2_9PEZI|nr:hypothetical protein Tdes44962_MAKER01436 [Teratosphaeria destructans]